MTDADLRQLDMDIMLGRSGALRRAVRLLLAERAEVLRRLAEIERREAKDNGDQVRG